MYILSFLLFRRYLSRFIQIIAHPDFHFSISASLVRSGDASLALKAMEVNEILKYFRCDLERMGR